MRVRDNGRQALVISEVNAKLLDLREGYRPLVVCVDCGSWIVVKRNLLKPHTVFDGPQPAVIDPDVSLKDPVMLPTQDKGIRCPGSLQRVDIKLSPDEWREHIRDHMAELNATADYRRRTRVFPRPKPSPAPSVPQLARRSPVEKAKHDTKAALRREAARRHAELLHAERLKAERKAQARQAARESLAS